MHSVRLQLATAVLVLWTACGAVAQEPIPVGPFFDYYPDHYVVADTETGLAWPAGEALDPPPSEPSMGSVTYSVASDQGVINYEQTKYAAGFTDWRLPSIDELLLARDHGLYQALLEVARLEGRTFPGPPSSRAEFGSWAGGVPVPNRGPWVNILAPAGLEVRWWPSQRIARSYLPVRKMVRPTPILWSDGIQTDAPRWGFDGRSIQYYGVDVVPDDRNGVNLSRVPDPAGGPGFAMRHYAVFGSGGSTRSQAGIWSFRNPVFAAQGMSPEGVYIAQEWYFPDVLQASGQPWLPWINLWDWHSVGPNGTDRWHTSPAIFLAPDGSMEFTLGWGHGLSGNPASARSSIPFPVGRWFDIEMYYKWTTETTTIQVWIDGEIALEQTVPRTRRSTHIVLETYPAKLYGGAPPGTAWFPTPSIKYTRNVRIAADRIWQED